MLGSSALTAARGATAITTTIAALAAIIARLGVFGRVAAIHPNLDADDAIHGASFGKAVVDRNTQSLKRHLALAILFGTGNVSTTQTAGDANTNAFAAHVHRCLH